MAAAKAAAEADSKTLRISLDSKAKVKIGNLSRQGKDRRQQAPKANDHDDHWEAVLVPFGILNCTTDHLSIYFGQSAETSDFIVDCLERWWQHHQANFDAVDTWVINLDGGSATRSNRTQFIKRMVTFARRTKLRIRLVYYPPYHSKYNPIERCWAALENFWNGAILDSIEAAVEWASNMTWKGIQPIVHLIEGTYEKGIKVAPGELAAYRDHWHPSQTLPKWDVTILPV